MKKLPAEIVAPLLAASTLLIPFHLPAWAIFFSWAATFAMGGPSGDNLKRIWITMPIGAFTAFLIVFGFEQASYHFTGNAFLVAQMVILFVLSVIMMRTSRIQYFNFTPGMFFGFATYFATYYGGFGWMPKNYFICLLATIAMNAVGPAFAWLVAKFSTRHLSH